MESDSKPSHRREDKVNGTTVCLAIFDIFLQIGRSRLALSLKYGVS